jgi:parvulin-like peptidyl-prolyl isomerase
VAQIEVLTKKDLRTVEGQLRSGYPFLTVASLATRNKLPGCDSNPCGDLGWTADAFVPSNRKQILTAKVGSVVGPIQEPNDWVLFLVEGRNPHYQLTNQQLYALRQQKFVAWLAQQQKLAKVTRNVAV